MAKKISVVTIITLMCVSLGCRSTGDSTYQLPSRTIGTYYPGKLISSDAGESDIIEIVVKSRANYKESLEALISFYAKSGNNEKYRNAKKELEALNTMPQYEYFGLRIDDPRYAPTTQIVDADLLYDNAMLDKKNAEKLGTKLFADKNLYRSALSKFRDLLRTYQKSDKIDDVAYEAGEISENLKDYTEALNYYKAAYTWNPYAPYPARLKAARVLDRNMHNYAEALPLYKLGLEREAQLENKYYELFKSAKKRVSELEKTVEP